MFVHDFTAVSTPVDDAVRAFSNSVSNVMLAAIVRTAWNDDAPILASAGVANPLDVSASEVFVELGGHRLRHDTAIISLHWSGNGWLPALDADLELVGFGHDCTHLHLMGRYELPPCVDRFSPAGSLVQRLMVVVVRRFLSDLSDLLAPRQ
ncbi:MAG: hypothetical protein ACC660_04665 [Acidimicrobiales bacterium]